MMAKFAIKNSLHRFLKMIQLYRGIGRPKVLHALIVIFAEFFAWGLLTTPTITALKQAFPGQTLMINGLIWGIKVSIFNSNHEATTGGYIHSSDYVDGCDYDYAIESKILHIKYPSLPLSPYLSLSVSVSLASFSRGPFSVNLNPPDRRPWSHDLVDQRPVFRCSSDGGRPCLKQSRPVHS